MATMPELFAAVQEADGPVLVLLHGFADCHRAWDDVRACLGSPMCILAYDLPGHGGSFAWPDAGPAKVAARAILADLDRRGIAAAHFAGHSMGGAVAVLAALADPERVASLTLLAPGGLGPEINQRLLERYAAARAPEDIRICLEAMFGWTSPVPEALVERQAEERGLPGRTEKLVGIAATLAREGRQGEIPRERLAGLAMPVTIAWGGLDNVLPVRQTSGLPGHFAVHVFADLGHMLPQEAPAEMARLIRRNIG